MNRVLLLLASLCLLATLTPAAGLARSGSTAGGYAAYAGSWYLHGFTLNVSGSTVNAVYRSYTWCSAQRKYGCDKIVGNTIYDGGVWLGSFQHAGASQASGTIYAGSDSSLLGTPFVLQRRPNDFISLTMGAGNSRQQLTLCGPHVPTSLRSQCGA